MVALPETLSALGGVQDFHAHWTRCRVRTPIRINQAGTLIVIFHRTHAPGFATGPLTVCHSVGVPPGVLHFKKMSTPISSDGTSQYRHFGPGVISSAVFQWIRVG